MANSGFCGVFSEEMTNRYCVKKSIVNIVLLHNRITFFNLSDEVNLFFFLDPLCSKLI